MDHDSIVKCVEIACMNSNILVEHVSNHPSLNACMNMILSVIKDSKNGKDIVRSMISSCELPELIYPDTVGSYLFSCIIPPYQECSSKCKATLLSYCEDDITPNNINVNIEEEYVTDSLLTPSHTSLHSVPEDNISSPTSDITVTNSTVDTANIVLILVVIIVIIILIMRLM